jgi:hypothetical protein
MGIKHSFVSAFRPEGNGLLERFHSNLGRSMKVRAAASRSINWDRELDSITFAYNIAEHGVTQATHHFIYYMGGIPHFHSTLQHQLLTQNTGVTANGSLLQPHDYALHTTAHIGV